MKAAVANEIRVRASDPRTLAQHLADVEAGTAKIADATSLMNLAAILIQRSAEDLDAWSRDETADPQLRATCAKWKGELGLKIADHLVNARPERDAGAQRVIVVREQDMGEIERSLMAEGSA
jgi:hypothetical protein